MSYTNEQALIDRFTELELIQLTGGDSMIDSDVLNAAISDADAEIDDYLRARYPLPLAYVPDTLARVAADIARFYLYADAVTSIVEFRYGNAVSFLKSIVAGRVSLPDDCIVVASGETLNSGIVVNAESKVFTSGTLSKMEL